MEFIIDADLPKAYNDSSIPPWYSIVDQNLVEADDADTWCVREQVVCDTWFKDFNYPKPLILIYERTK